MWVRNNRELRCYAGQASIAEAHSNPALDRMPGKNLNIIRGI